MRSNRLSTNIQRVGPPHSLSTCGASCRTLLSAAAGLLLVGTATTAHAQAPGGMHLVWSDEFTGAASSAAPYSGFWNYNTGGGGWGNPAERDPLAVLQDVKDGFVSVHSACEDYGVVIEPDTWKIDWRQTQERRAAMPAAPPLFDRGTFYEQMERVRS